MATTQAPEQADTNNIEDAFELTPMQLGILLSCIRNRDAGLYHSQVEFELHGSYQAADFTRVFECLLAHHKTFRTAFAWDGLEQPLQVVLRQLPDTAASAPEQHDTQHLHEHDFAEFWQTLKARDRQKEFDLAAPPLSRLYVCRRSPSAFKVLWSYHHLLLDGWSALALLEEFCTALSNPDWAPAPRTDFRAYVAGLKHWREHAELSWWTNQLQGFDEVNRLRCGSSTLSNTDAEPRHDVVSISAPDELRNRLLTTASSRRCTTGQLVHACWALVLQRLSRSDDILFGVTVAGRPSHIARADSIIGLCINTLPVRHRFAASDTIASLTATTAEWQQHLLTDECIALADLHKHTDVPPGQALFESIVVSHDFRSTHDGPLAQLQQLKFREYSEIPVALLWSNQQDFNIDILFRRDHLTRTNAQRLAAATLETLQQFITAPPTTPLTALSLSPAPTDTRPTQAPVAGQELGANLFKHISDTNSAPALVFQQTTLTYAQLNQAVMRLVQVLHQASLDYRQRVGINLSDPQEYVLAILACVRCGICYVPLNPAWPAARWAQTVAAAELDGIIADTSAATLQDITQVRIPAAIFSADIVQNSPAQPVQNNDLAYVLFTSGSTGQPKGVGISYANLAYSTATRVQYYAQAEDTQAHHALAGGPPTFLLLSEFTFDSSVAGIFGTLSQGGCLVLTDTAQRRDLHALGLLAEQQQVTATLCVPSLYRSMLNQIATQLSALRQITVAGENCPPALLAQHCALLPDTALFNEYGPTEATVWCSVARLHPPATGTANVAPVSIGHAIPGTRLDCADKCGQPLPPGFVGELRITGPGVTAGYLHADAAQNPFTGDSYTTGDLTFAGDKGEFYFVGRVDRQMKIRGQRFDPTEMENRLLTMPGIEEAALAMRRVGNATQPVLVAYCAGASVPALTLLNKSLGEFFPASMLPQHLVAMAQLPRNRNGKLDLAALPDVAPSAPNTTASASTTASLSVTQADIAAVWQALLGVDQVQPHDNFFALGGDSINALEVTVKLRRMGMRVDPNDIFAHPTLSALAERIEQTVDAGDSGVAGTDLDETSQPALLPAANWFFRHNFAHPNHWNMPLLLQLEDNISIAHLSEALQCLHQQMPALRQKYIRTDEGWLPTGLSEQPLHSAQHHLDTPADGASDSPLLQLCAQLQTGLDIISGRLFKADFIFHNNTYLLLTFHHLAVDGVSLRLLLDELRQAYDAAVEQRTYRIAGAPVSATQWASRWAAATHAGRFDDHLAYWHTVVSQARADSNLQPEDAASERQAGSNSVRLPTGQYTKLLATMNEQDVDVEAALMTATAHALQTHLGTGAVTFDLEGHGRRVPVQTDLSQTIGWLTQRFPLRLPHLLGLPSADALSHVQRLRHAVPARGVTYQTLAYHKPRQLADFQPDICFNFFGKFDTQTGLGKLVHSQNLLAHARHPDNHRPHVLDITAQVDEQGLVCTWTYNTSQYSNSVIAELGRLQLGYLHQLSYSSTQGAEPGPHGLQADTMDDLLEGLE